MGSAESGEATVREQYPATPDDGPRDDPPPPFEPPPWREDLWQRGSSLLEGRRQDAEAWCDAVVKALGTGAMVLEAEELALTADMVRAFERRLQQAQRDVISRPLEETLDDARAMTLRAPAAALGGAFALGFLAARFLRSSSMRAATAADSDGPEKHPNPAGSSTPPPAGGRSASS